MTQREKYILKFMANASITYSSDDNYRYSIDEDDNLLTLLYYLGNVKNLLIPTAFYQGDIDKIACSCFYDNENIAAVKISEGITEIM